jgi:hypothetical protein
MSLPKTYAEIIEDTILTLNESIGSSRQAIWKAVSGAYPAADYKLFVVRLKKMREAGQIAQKGGKFRLEITYKHKLLKALEKGKSGKKVAKSSVSLKKGAKKTAAKKGKGPAKKATKKAQKERKAAAVAKRGKAGKKAGAKKGKAAAAKKAAEKAASEEEGRADAPVSVIVAAAAIEAKAAKPVKKAKKADAPVAAPQPAPVAAPEPVAAPAEENDDAPEFLPFKFGGLQYLRLGTKREDGNHLWATGDLWSSKKGVKGAYVGCITESGEIDTDAEEPTVE